ncbi:MAG: YHS domain-containing (seleno)protein [Verrucomicrobiota bacterium]
MILLKQILSILALLSVGLIANAKEPIYTGTFSNIALGGYDSVSYFDSKGKPLKGSKAHTLEWRGAKWRFISEANLKKFEANPEAFAPSYGGYCAWAISQGKLAKGDPSVFALVDGKLFLNYNAEIEERWQANRDAFIEEAEVKYPKLVTLGEPPKN